MPDLYQKKILPELIKRQCKKLSLTQEELAQKIQLMGVEDMTKLIISRIEKNQRHVCDAELRILAKALGVTMEWLVGDADEQDYGQR